VGGDGSGWRKSSFSDRDDCVEVRPLAGRVLVRDSKNRRAGVLSFDAGEWRCFLAGLRSGEFGRTDRRR
jgi:hypothetical protein